MRDAPREVTAVAASGGVPVLEEWSEKVCACAARGEGGGGCEC